MRGRYWRLSRPLGCCLCILLCVLLAWLLRMAYGVPAMGAKAQLRRTERRLLREPGELVEVFEEGSVYAAAVTWHDGQIRTYALFPESEELMDSDRDRYTDGMPWRETESAYDWGCTTASMDRLEPASGAKSTVVKRRLYVLVRQTDPRIVSGTLRIIGRLGSRERPWESEAVRTNPYYLAFPIELWGGTDESRQMYYAIQHGTSQAQKVTAMAEGVFYDAEGNEVEKKRFQLILNTPEEKGSDDSGA